MRFSAPYAGEEASGDEEKKLAARKLTFFELSQICLWVRPSPSPSPCSTIWLTRRDRALQGNSTDLSLLIDMTEEDIKKLQSTGGENLAATLKNILGNDLEKIWTKVSKLNGGRIGSSLLPYLVWR